MTDEDLDFQRRVTQFHSYLEPMYRRSREAQEFRFIIFEDHFTDEAGIVHRSAAKSRPRSLVSFGSGIFTPDEVGLLDALDSEMEVEHPRNRYVQVGFERDYFFMDMPVESIFPDEADEIVATRHGFRRASANPITSMNTKDIKDFDPLQKFYFYGRGEEREAAEDLAGIFFKVWGLPTNTRLYVSSHSASGMTWERGEPFE